MFINSIVFNFILLKIKIESINKSQMALITNDELHDKLNEKIKLLKLSIENYNKGYEIVVQQISTDIRTLVHDTNNSKSLLNHLNIKDKLKFYDTTLIHQFKSQKIKEHFFPNFSHTFGFSDISLKPIFEKEICLLNDFDGWWKGDITKYKEQQLISREQLILNLANKDGGAHIDKNLELDETYAKITRNDHFTFKGINSLGENILQENSPEKPLVYVIAKELICSLEDYLNGINNQALQLRTHSMINIVDDIEASIKVKSLLNLLLKKNPQLELSLSIPMLLDINQVNILLHLGINSIKDIDEIVESNIEHFKSFVEKEREINPTFFQFCKLEDLVFQFLVFFNKEKFASYKFIDMSEPIFKNLVLN